MSRKLMLLPYTYVELTTAPASAERAAHIGELALVPPTVNQPAWFCSLTLSKTETPEAGSASSDTSGVARLPPQVTCAYCGNDRCAEVAVSKALQPPPPLLQPVSPVKAPPLKCSVVPPTEITFGEADGYSAGRPASPEDTKKLTPVWAKWISELDSPENSLIPQLSETYWAWVL